MATDAADLPDDGLFSEVRLADVRRALIRNIVSLRVSEDLFDDLSDRPEDWKLAQQVESALKPTPYRSPVPIIHRPFEEAAWMHAVGFPFSHWTQSRYSDGSYGVWYGADTVQTSIWETAYHWYCGFLADAGFQRPGVVCERKLYQVQCEAALLDLRRLSRKYPALAHPRDYGYTQSLGRRIHREGHPGLVSRSVRFPEGESYAIFNAAVLSRPRQHGSLRYRLGSSRIEVEFKPGEAVLELALDNWNAAGQHPEP